MSTHLPLFTMCSSRSSRQAPSCPASCRPASSSRASSSSRRWTPPPPPLQVAPPYQVAAAPAPPHACLMRVNCVIGILTDSCSSRIAQSAAAGAHHACSCHHADEDKGCIPGVPDTGGPRDTAHCGLCPPCSGQPRGHRVGRACGGRRGGRRGCRRCCAAGVCSRSSEAESLCEAAILATFSPVAWCNYVQSVTRQHP